MNEQVQYKQLFKVKKYNNNYYEIIRYNKSMSINYEVEGDKKNKKSDVVNGILKNIDDEEEKYLKDVNLNYERSLRRRRKTVRDYALCNEWNYFCTLTLDKNKIDRYDYDFIKKKLSKWLNNYKSRKDKNFRYIIIPEYHKIEDGKDVRAIHFHGLLYIDDESHLVESQDYYNKKSHTFEMVYNWLPYQKKFGFTNLTKLKNVNKSSNYITKYITKGNDVKLNSRDNMLVSKKLKKSITVYQDDFSENVLISDDIFDFTNEWISKKQFTNLEDLNNFLENIEKNVKL